MNEGKVVGNESREGEMQAEGESVSPLKPLCKSLWPAEDSQQKSHMVRLTLNICWLV